VVPAENPEQGIPGRALDDGIEPIVASLEEQLGLRLDFPDVGAPYGLRAGARLISPDMPEQIYAAERLSAAVKQANLRPQHIVEIGAGYGGMAYWFLQRHRNVAQYTIVDLPVTNVLHGYFLSKALGRASVSFIGEQPARIVVLPENALQAIRPHVDVVVNKDSMPEMSRDTMHDYLRWIAANCRGLFFSYNQEGQAAFGDQRQGVVFEGVRHVSGLRRLRRDMSWLRRGYVEEIYLVGPDSVSR
jgi:hypothetical protein